MPLAPLLRSVRFENFKGLRDLTVDFERLTVLVGANAVGKTSILEGISLPGKMLHGSMTKRNPDLALMGRWSPEAIIRLGQSRATIDLQLEQSRLLLIIEHSPQEPLRWLAPGETDLTRSINAPAGRTVIDFLSTTSRLRLDQERIAQPSPAAQSTPELAADGSGLASYLQYLHGRRDGTLDAIEEYTREVIPRFKRVQFRPTSITHEESETIVIDGERIVRPARQRQIPATALHVEFDEGVVPATHASEGTMIVLALLTAAYAPQGHSLLLIDDLDRALHPAAQFRLIAALRQALAAQPELQIIATSHSPDLINACRSDEVRVLGFDPDRGPVAASLADHPEASRWLKQLRPGEFWDSAGEEWVSKVAAQTASEQSGG